MITATFANLYYSNLSDLLAEAASLGLEFVSSRVEDELYVDLCLRGKYDMIQAMENLVYSKENLQSR